MSKSKILSGVGIVLGAAVLLFSTTLFGGKVCSSQDMSREANRNLVETQLPLQN